MFVDDTTNTFMESHEWVNAIDRGGLVKVKNLTYELFLAIEKALQAMLSTSHPVSKISMNGAKAIIDDEDVQFVWCLPDQSI